MRAGTGLAAFRHRRLDRSGDQGALVRRDQNAGQARLFPLAALPQEATSKLRLIVAGQSHEATVKGGRADSVTADFGSFEIAQPGYQCFALESLNARGQAFGDIDALILDGPAIAGCALQSQVPPQRRLGASGVPGG